MTLRAAVRWGIAGSAVPFAGVAAWFVVGAVVGEPMANVASHAGPLALALPYLAPAAVFGFLVVLYRAAAGLTQPSRVGDAGLAASVVAMVALAASLRWTAFPQVFSGPMPDVAVWLYRAHWLASQVLVPVAWLVLLATFVRWPAPPLARASCRAAGWLALVIPLAGLWQMWHLVETLMTFWLSFPPRGSYAFYAWIGLAQGFLGALHWILMLAFALLVWRMRVAAEPGRGA